MQIPEIPENEVERIAALVSCQILDSKPEPRFDRLTKLTSKFFEVPIALVSLVDSERQWFKSRQGLDATETPRDISFCGHAILEDEIFCIADTLEDPRFIDNPLVTAPPSIRFYAGAPLKNYDGYRIGTLCLIDTKPRHLTPTQFEALRDFADCVESEINRTTERAAEKQKLSQTANLLSNVLDSTNEYTFIATDINGQITTFNRGAEKMLDFSAKEAVGKMNLTDFHLQRDIEQRVAELTTEFNCPIDKFQAIVEIASRRGTEKREWNYVCKSDRLIPVSLLVTAMHEQNGEISGYLVIVNDVRDEKAHASQQRLQLGALNAAANAIMITDVEGKIRWTNPAWSRLSGFSAEEVIGENPRIVKSDKQDADFYQHLWSTIKSGNIWQGEIINQRKDGSQYYEFQTITPLLDEKENLEAFIAVKEDISEQKDIESALQDHAAKTQAVVDNIIDGIITIDKIGTVQSLNPAAEKMFGYRVDEVVDRNIKMLMPEPHRKQHDSYLYNYLATGIERIIGIGREVEGLRKDGSQFPLDLSVTQIERQGEIQYVGLLRDITERKRIEKMKTEFVSTVSHELRTPLTSISGSLGLITGGAFGDMPEQANKMLDIAHKNSLRLTYLINDLLDMEKLVAGKMSFDMRFHSTKQMIDLALESNQDYGAGRGVKLVATGEVPELKIRVDQQRLMQVFSNLISNAIKYSPDGENVEISVEVSASNIIISVKDNGPGIPKEFRKQIFQKFSQADSSDTRIQSGTGLGLAITRELVERMDGHIGFESVENQGSRFFFELPRLDILEAGTQSTSGRLSSGKKPILVVEDESDVARLIAMILERAGYQVDIAFDGAQALEALEKKHYAGMTLDLMLPDISGLEVIAKARNLSNGKELPIVVISAKMEQGKLALKTSGDNIEWLAKPIEEDNLVEILAKKIASSLDKNGERSRVLHIEDDQDLHQVIAAMIGGTVSLDLAVNLAEARQLITSGPYDTILLDLRLPDGDGSDLLPLIRERLPKARVVILSADDPTRKEAQAVESVLIKSQISPAELLSAIKLKVE